VRPEPGDLQRSIGLRDLLARYRSIQDAMIEGRKPGRRGGKYGLNGNGFQ
jgi:hypothetical protein